MGNKPIPSHLDNKFLQSSFTLKEHSNMPSDTKQKKKVRFNSKLENQLDISHDLNPYKASAGKYLDVNYGNKPSRFKNNESFQIQRSQRSMVMPSSDRMIINDEEDSLRVTHIDADTKKSQVKQNTPSLFNIFTPNKPEAHKSMLHQRAQQQTKLEMPQISKSKSRSQNHLRTHINEGITQQKPQSKDNQKKDKINEGSYIRIPSAIDDIDTIQLNQSNPQMWLKNTLKTSQNTVKQICNQNYTKKGYFLLTDTNAGKKDIQAGITQNKSVHEKQKLENQIDNNNQDKNKQSSTSTECQCNIIMPFLKIFSAHQRDQARQDIRKLKSEEIKRQFELPEHKLIVGKKGNINNKKQQDSPKFVSKSY